MTPFLFGVARSVAETFSLPDPIVEIGSYRVPGQESLANLRGLFPGRAYEGIDIRPGPGVDRVASVEQLPYADASVGCVIALSTFEHVRKFWQGFAEIHRVLRPDGVLVVACPFNVRIHCHPSDYWRFTPQSLEVLLEDYPSKLIGFHGPEQQPENVWAVAFREKRSAIRAEEFQRYQELMNRYARHPLKWRRKLRYRLIDWLDGRGLCSPYLQREQWIARCLEPLSDGHQVQ